MHLNLRSRKVAWFGKQRKGFGSSLDSSRLNASGAIADSLLRDQDKQAVYFVIAERTGSTVPPGDPDLQRVLEAELAR